MLLSPSQQSFLELPTELNHAKIALFGAPASRGTATIRQASHSLNSYSPLMDKDLREEHAVDLGDINPSDLSATQQATQAILEQGAKPVLFGEDPIYSLPLFEALLQKHPDLLVLQLDAHTGLRSEYKGETHCHHTLMHHISDILQDPQRILVYGPRSGQKEEFQKALTFRTCGPFPSFDHQRLGGLRYHLGSMSLAPMLVLCDLDVFDPSLVPEARHPEAGGIRYEELCHALNYLKGCNIAGVSVTGWSSHASSTTVTSTLAAKLLLEFSLLTTL